ncbi:MAG TPA: PDZ domain-containing protein [Chitinophagaceae bacterium]|nr:PDZ domain-containing protein [Chitinophagaceae bacterium]
MKNVFRISLALAILATGIPAFAQEKQEMKKDKSDKEKLKQYDEIIIRKKTDDAKDSKVTIRIKDGEVLVNGKPLDKFESDDISVIRRHTPRIIMRSPSPFRAQAMGPAWDEMKERFNVSSNKAFLGVSTEKADKGAKVSAVSEGSAAEKAGLKVGDEITSVNDQKIEGPEDLVNAIGKYKPEDKISISYLRDGKMQQTEASLGANKMAMAFNFSMPENMHQFMPEMRSFQWRGSGPMFPGMEMPRGPRLGLKAQDTEDGKGVKVLDIMDGSAAEKAGLKEGDIITEFDGKTVNSADALADAARDARDKTSVSIKLLRDGQSQTVELKTPRRLKTANL